jgi:hypothetical protein
MCEIKALTALKRGADNINNAGINSKKRILYIYKSIEGAEAAESYYNRRNIYSAERLNRISQANAAVRSINTNNNIDNINNGDVAFEPRSDVVATNKITSREGANVSRSYNAGQRAVSSETGAGKKRKKRRRRSAAEDIKIYKIIKRKHKQKKDNNIRKYNK